MNQQYMQGQLKQALSWLTDQSIDRNLGTCEDVFIFPWNHFNHFYSFCNHFEVWTFWFDSKQTLALCLFGLLVIVMPLLNIFTNRTISQLMSDDQQIDLSHIQQ